MKRHLTILSFSLIAITGLSGCNSQVPQLNASDSVDTNISNELTIATLFEDPLIESAARRFEAMYNGRYTVTLVTHGDFTSYAQIVNTALMSGGGEDIISASQLTWQRLADAGMLVDLNNKINFESGVYYQSVLDSFLYNSGRYVIPLSFTIGTFKFNDMVTTNANLDRFTLEDLLAFAHTYPEIPLLTTPMGVSETGVAFTFFELNFNYFIDLTNRQANVDNEKFIALLEGVQSVGDRLRWPEPGEPQLITGDIFFNATMASGGLLDYEAFHIMTNDRGEGLVRTSSLMAINSNSKNQELATRFIEFLISEEIQSLPEMWSNPVNKNAAEIVSRATLESVLVEGYIPFDGFNLERNIVAFNQLASRLVMSGTSDPFIGEFVMTEMIRFFDGEVTAQQAATNLQARLTTYLNE